MFDLLLMLDSMALLGQAWASPTLSLTALGMCILACGPLTEDWMSACGWGQLAECAIDVEEMTTDVEAYVATYFCFMQLWTMNHDRQGRQPTGGINYVHKFK